MNNKIGIVGNGFVGKATKVLCGDCIIFDVDETKCEPKGTTISDIKKCDIIFVCVPTPMQSDGKCYLGIVDNVIESLKGYEENIVLRSTVPVGTCVARNINFMPEFLTEKNWFHDVKNCKSWILGIQHDSMKQKLSHLLYVSQKENRIDHNDHFITKPSDAELVKYIRNTFLAMKVSYFNEIYNFCSGKNLNFDHVRNLVCQDERIGHSHSYIYNDKTDGYRGFGGTCFPKDLSSLIEQFKESNIESPILNSVQFRNNNIDRPSKEWMNDKGRSSI